MEILETVPKTALDIFRMLPEGTLCDVIDNVLYINTPPKLAHQRLLKSLAFRLFDHTEKMKMGEIIIYPIDVYLEHLLSAVQPDITYISNENMGVVKDDGYVHGAPDLIVEVLSGDIKRNKVKKKSLYERAGVKEYFIASPKTKKIECFVLINGRYTLAYADEGVFKSALLGLTFTF